MQMIFLFFSSSLACLEPELELFEVWEINVRQIIIIANGINSQTTKLQRALTRVLDELERNQKKGKSSTNNFQDDGHISSCPVVHVQLQEACNPTSWRGRLCTLKQANFGVCSHFFSVSPQTTCNCVVGFLKKCLQHPFAPTLLRRACTRVSLAQVERSSSHTKTSEFWSLLTLFLRQPPNYTQLCGRIFKKNPPTPFCPHPAPKSLYKGEPLLTWGRTGFSRFSLCINSPCSCAKMLFGISAPAQVNNLADGAKLPPAIYIHFVSSTK